MGGFGLTELLVIFAIDMVLFGSKRVPSLIKNLGGSIKDFRKALTEIIVTYARQRCDSLSPRFNGSSIILSSSGQSNTSNNL